MRIRCLHGYFKFTEQYAGQISEFRDLFQVEIESNGDHFTFSDLVGAPRFSIAGGLYLGAPAIKTFEGDPWEVMRQNDLVYDFTMGKVVPIATILTNADLSEASNYFLADGMILPGSLTDEGLRVTDYSAFYVEGIIKFKYSEVILG